MIVSLHKQKNLFCVTTSPHNYKQKLLAANTVWLLWYVVVALCQKHTVNVLVLIDHKKFKYLLFIKNL